MGFWPPSHCTQRRGLTEQRGARAPWRRAGNATLLLERVVTCTPASCAPALRVGAAEPTSQVGTLRPNAGKRPAPALAPPVRQDHDCGLGLCPAPRPWPSRRSLPCRHGHHITRFCCPNNQRELITAPHYARGQLSLPGSVMGSGRGGGDAWGRKPHQPPPFLPPIPGPKKTPFPPPASL